MTPTWEVKYRNTITDFLGHVWVTDLLYYGYSGPIIEVKAAGVPIEMTTLGEGDDESGIKPREWILSWLNETNFQFLELFTGTAREWKMKLYKDTVLVGCGWVDPDNYSEEFSCVPYPSQIHVNDGLGELKYIFYSLPDNPTGTIYRGLMAYIVAAFNEVGLELPIYVAWDIIFEKADGTKVEDQVFDKICVDWRVFRTGEYEYMSYYDILSDIIAAFEGVRIFQEAGAWWIDRAGVFKTAAYDVNKYYSAGEFHETVSKNALVPLTSNSVALPVRFGSDAELTVVPGWKQFTIKQEYGAQKTILDCWNIFGYFWYDEWRTDLELWSWTRRTTLIEKGEGDCVFMPRFATGDIPIGKGIQSNKIDIDQDTLIQIMRSWARKDGNVSMKLSVDYKVVPHNFDADIDNFRLYFRVIIQDSLGNYWTSFKWLDHAMFTRLTAVTVEEPNYYHAIEVEPSLGKWTTYEVDIVQVAFPWINLVEWWKVYVEIMPAWSSLSSGEVDTGLFIRRVNVCWYDKNNEDGVREIDNLINTKNRAVPASINVKFGETPGVIGTSAEKDGRELTDTFIFYDDTGEPIQKWGTTSAGIMGGLLGTVMSTALHLKHALPSFRLRGTVRDNPDTMDFCSILQDYDSRKYVSPGMSRNVGMNEVQGEWLQIREPEQETGGEFNWDFSNDFNI